MAGRLLVGMLVGKWQRLDSTHIYGLKHFISQTGCAVGGYNSPKIQTQVAMVARYSLYKCAC